MIRKLRKASLQWSAKRRDSAAALSSHDEIHNSDASFLGLPPEIRNQIYEHVAKTTTLTLATVKSRKKPSPVGLLLACRQTHHEYRALMLSQAKIIAWISGFDFSNIVRVLQTASAADTTALQKNKRLSVSLFIGHVASTEELRYLLQWLTYHANVTSENAVRWDYDVMWGGNLRPPRPAARYHTREHMKQDLMNSFIRRFTRMRPAVLELAGSTDELDRLSADFERRIFELEMSINEEYEI